MTKENVGDIVEIKTAKDTFKGTLLESYEPSVYLLKLDSGYNIGIEKAKVKSIKIIGKARAASFPEIKMKSSKNLPGISIISTGGTISSRIDYKTGAVKWLMKPEQVFALAPKMLNIVKINKIESPFMMASENMSAENWIDIAKIAVKLLNEEENKGIIITHGTDTLHYTSAALSFMLQNLNKPVVLTYAQRSTDRGSTDTPLNLTCSAYVTLSNIAEVMLVGHSSINDNFCYALRGTKVRKMHTSRRDTFRPINDLPIAKISEDGQIDILAKEFNVRNDKKVIADTEFEEKIALIKYYPGANFDIIDFYKDQKYKGIIIEATGLGHVGTEEAKYNWIPSIRSAIDAGMTICFAPQTFYGRLDPYVYAPGRELLKAGVIYLSDILPETAYVKLGWVLGHTKEKEKIKELMLKNLAGEFNSQISEKAFLF
ncbi:MAG: Glu-tRNA(Gln) amidotransferase subunit GatD [Candidatus Pacearchaeota archaeon]